MTDRELFTMVLETLDNMVKVDWREWDEFASVEDFVRWAKSRASFTAEALRARLSQPEPAECDGGQCGIGGYCKQCPKTQLDVPEIRFGKMPETINMENFVGSGKPLVPVAWISCNAGLYHGKPDESLKPLPLYTTPPQREWISLTEEEHTELAIECGCLSVDWVFYGAAVEQKLKEKNT